MAAITSIISAVGLAASVAGTAGGVMAAQQSAKAQEKAETARNSAMNLDAERRKRAVVREMQMQRAVALSNATVQGAGEGSGLQGAYGSITGQGMTNATGITQQQQLGNQVFAANRQDVRAKSRGAAFEGLTTLGGSMMRNAGTIESIGNYMFA